MKNETQQPAPEASTPYAVAAAPVPRRNVRRRAVLAICVAASAALMHPAGAQEWPSKPIRIIVPFAAGGPSDRLGRILADELRGTLNQSIVIENVGGAGGSIGMGLLARAAPDGHTFGVAATSTHAITPFLSARQPYDPIKDFTPIAKLTDYDNVLIVNAQHTVRSVRDLVALARAKPGQVTFGSAGVGTSTHLSGELLKTAARIDMTHVPYKGLAPAQADLLAGSIDFMFGDLGTAMRLVESGRLRAIASTGPTRLKQYPNLPTVAESVPGFEVRSWFALFGPPGLAPEVVTRLNREIVRIVASPKYVQALLDMGYDAASSSPDELRDRLVRDLATWEPILKALGTRIQ